MEQYFIYIQDGLLSATWIHTGLICGTNPDNLHQYLERIYRDRMVVGFITTYQSVPITTDVVGLNLDQGDVYNIMW